MTKKSLGKAKYALMMAMVSLAVLAAGSTYASVNIKNSVDVDATGGNATVNQSQSQSQSQTQSTNNSDSQTTQSQQSSQSQVQSASAEGGDASVDVKTGKNHRGDRNEKRGHRRLPATGSGSAGLLAISALAVAGAVVGSKKLAAKIQK